MFDVKSELDKLPKQPGVYLMHDEKDNIIYVGKAVNLYNRVRSYFRAGVKHTPKINKMISLIDHFEYIVVDSDLEAFVLENNLIKEHNPKYNTLLKDSKTYPYIKVTLNEDYPRIIKVRTSTRDKARYFGPYTSEFSVGKIIELLNATYSLRTCNKKVCEGVENDRPCLNYHMNRCLAPCSGNVSKEEYRKNVEAAIDFLNGNDKSLIKDLKTKMQEASERMDYEEAMRYRDILESADFIIQKQKISNSDEMDRDVVAIATDEDDAVVQVFFVRNGKMIGREHYHIGEITGMPEREILSEFLKRYYSGTPFIPKEIMLPFEIEDGEMMEEWLSSLKGTKCKLMVPKMGTKERLVELAKNNALIVLRQDKEKIVNEEKRTTGAFNELKELLQLPEITRVEAFDISNTNGFENVGSMVVFENGKALKSDYRKFKIRSVSGPDDYACMYEVLSRRFMHGFEERKKLETLDIEAKFGGFSKFPDLILMDGGRGQVNIACKVLKELELSIPVCGMVKDDHHRTRGLYVDGKEIDIDTHSEAFKLITRVQDEAHRFAIEFHKSLRSNKQVKSLLDEIEGIGPKRKRILMGAFESIEDIKNASIEDLKVIEDIPEGVAKSIYNFFHTSQK